MGALALKNEAIRKSGIILTLIGTVILLYGLWLRFFNNHPDSIVELIAGPALIVAGFFIRYLGTPDKKA